MIIPVYRHVLRIMQDEKVPYYRLICTYRRDIGLNRWTRKQTQPFWLYVSFDEVPLSSFGGKEERHYDPDTGWTQRWAPKLALKGIE